MQTYPGCVLYSKSLIGIQIETTSTEVTNEYDCERPWQIPQRMCAVVSTGVREFEEPDLRGEEQREAKRMWCVTTLKQKDNCREEREGASERNINFLVVAISIP